MFLILVVILLAIFLGVMPRLNLAPAVSQAVSLILTILLVLFAIWVLFQLFGGGAPFLGFGHLGRC